MTASVLKAASEMITTYVHGARGGHTYPDISISLLICHLARAQSRTPGSYTPRSTNEELQRIGFINTDWTPVLAYGQEDPAGQHLYKKSTTWVESVMGPFVTVGGHHHHPR
jgi:hypothetical protein